MICKNSESPKHSGMDVHEQDMDGQNPRDPDDVHVGTDTDRSEQMTMEMIPDQWKDTNPLIDYDEYGYDLAVFFSFTQHIQYTKTGKLAFISEYQDRSVGDGCYDILGDGNIETTNSQWSIGSPVHPPVCLIVATILRAALGGKCWRCWREQMRERGKMGKWGDKEIVNPGMAPSGTVTASYRGRAMSYPP
ncbi:hypothetical protein DEU56DRAFT_754386 [Suillus clintonianus]|uniref:uncharacterized protein n=1 Tax=Suillus clintonianus TaxID=1904413 RepID=UPI001B863BB5|nr:uncharacterized protein DEU56DRAFT_754386 [Suillus clintonianus]KAG2144340.1 hypothetical protein DEU56DRAFT_754386 [Suillus clintonianus]